MSAKRILIFASGSGSNAENMIHYFREKEMSGDGRVEIVGILTNNAQAGVIERADRLGIACEIFNREQWKNTEYMLELVGKYKADLIVLAGFLWKFPDFLIAQTNGKVINLHPALLPKFGGKGMFGMHVHEAVVAHGETETGITIHWVNEHYDEGNIIAQFSCRVENSDTASDVAEKIHQLEGAHFPAVVDSVLQQL